MDDEERNEVRDGDPVIRGVCSTDSSDNNSPSATFTISPGGLSSESTPVSTPEASGSKVEPLLVLPIKFGDSKIYGKDDECIDNSKSAEPDGVHSKQDLSSGHLSAEYGLQQMSSKSDSSSLKNSTISKENKQRKISLVERVQQISLEPESLPEDSSTTDETKHRKISFVERAQHIPSDSDFLSLESAHTKDEKKQRKISLVERVQQIPLEGEVLSSESTTNETRRRKISFVERFQMIPFTADQEGNNNSPQNLTPRTSPLVTPQATPPLQRKPLGMAMEKGNKTGVHSYFFTKPFQSSEQEFSTVAEMSSKANEVSPSSGSSLRAQQLEDGSNLAQSLDLSNKVMGKRRPRPKPSTLREMNFWAPTSM